jgi:hypothetical protein
MLNKTQKMNDFNPNHGFIFDVPINTLLYKSHFDDFTKCHKAYQEATARIPAAENKAIHVAALKEIAHIEQNIDEIALTYRAILTNCVKDLIERLAETPDIVKSQAFCLGFRQDRAEADGMLYTLEQKLIQFTDKCAYPMIDKEGAYTMINFGFAATLGFFYNVIEIER